MKRGRSRRKLGRMRREDGSAGEPAPRAAETTHEEVRGKPNDGEEEVREEPKGGKDEPQDCSAGELAPQATEISHEETREEPRGAGKDEPQDGSDGELAPHAAEVTHEASAESASQCSSPVTSSSASASGSGTAPSRRTRTSRPADGYRPGAREVSALSVGLLMTCRSGDLSIDEVQCLLEDAADINYVDRHGRSALLAAVRSNGRAVCGALLDSRADPNLTGDTHPLVEAVGLGHAELARLLLDAGANATARKPGWRRAEAQRRPSLGVSQLVGDLHGTGDTALHLAVQGGHVEISALLLEHEASVNARDQHRAKPLALAHSEKISHMLLEYRALAELESWMYPPELDRVSRYPEVVWHNGGSPSKRTQIEARRAFNAISRDQYFAELALWSRRQHIPLEEDHEDPQPRHAHLIHMTPRPGSCMNPSTTAAPSHPRRPRSASGARSMRPPERMPHRAVASGRTLSSTRPW